MTKRLDDLLVAAETGALRDGSDTSLAALVAEVRRERARMYRRLLVATILRLYAEHAADMARTSRRMSRAANRVRRLLHGEPAFGVGK